MATTDPLQKIKNKSKLAYFLTIAFSISFLIAVPTLLMLFIGMGVDELFHKKPLFTLTGALLGFLSSFYNIYRLLKRIT